MTFFSQRHHSTLSSPYKVIVSPLFFYIQLKKIFSPPPLDGVTWGASPSPPVTPLYGSNKRLRVPDFRPPVGLYII